MLKALGRNDEALACYRKALAVDSSMTEVEKKIDELTRQGEDKDGAADPT